MLVRHELRNFVDVYVYRGIVVLCIQGELSFSTKQENKGHPRVKGRMRSDDEQASNIETLQVWQKRGKTVAGKKRKKKKGRLK
jgi:hypothetical protein